MTFVDRIVPTKQTRLKLTIICLIINYAIILYALHKGGITITDIGTGLALLNAPLYGYILGQTFKPDRQPIESNEQK